jgi:hypothetical protein
MTLMRPAMMPSLVQRLAGLVSGRHETNGDSVQWCKTKDAN